MASDKRRQKRGSDVDQRLRRESRKRHKSKVDKLRRESPGVVSDASSLSSTLSTSLKDVLPTIRRQDSDKRQASESRVKDMVRFEQVSKRYPSGRDALSAINFSVASGEFVFLTGHSGAGKSTMLKIMTAVEKASSGRVSVDGHDLAVMRREVVPYFRRRIGVVYQDHKLLEESTVFDNVALPLMVRRARTPVIQRYVRAALSRVGLLDRERMLPNALSGGEQQRIGIARAIVNSPHLILADEPTGNLDPQLADEIMDLFRDLNRSKVTVMVATHDPRHFSSGEARVLELRDGVLVKDTHNAL